MTESISKKYLKNLISGYGNCLNYWPSCGNSASIRDPESGFLPTQEWRWNGHYFWQRY